MENDNGFISREMTPREVIEFRTQRELGDQVAEFESVYRELYPNQWVGFLNGQVVMRADTYERFVAQFDDFSDDDRRRILTRNYRSENPNSI